jgi:hypothetical protein
VKKSFNIQELLHLKSKHHGTKPMDHPSSSRAFQRDQESDLKLLVVQNSWFSGSHKYKQNKQTTFLHEWIYERSSLEICSNEFFLKKIFHFCPFRMKKNLYTPKILKNPTWLECVLTCSQWHSQLVPNMFPI